MNPLPIPSKHSRTPELSYSTLEVLYADLLSRADAVKGEARTALLGAADGVLARMQDIHTHNHHGVAASEEACTNRLKFIQHCASRPGMLQIKPARDTETGKVVFLLGARMPVVPRKGEPAPEAGSEPRTELLPLAVMTEPGVYARYIPAPESELSKVHFLEPAGSKVNVMLIRDTAPAQSLEKAHLN